MFLNECIFERVEKKYLLKTAQSTLLLQTLADRLRPGAYGRHTIENIYCDTPDFDLIRMSLDRPAYKEKLRVRSYGTPQKNDRVFVELKKKFDGVVYKRRAPMTLDDAERFLFAGRQPESGGQILQELSYALNFYGAQPMLLLSYDRVAFECPEAPGLRLTFDRDIRYRTKRLSLSAGPFGEPVLPPDTCLLEIKTPGALPLFLAHALSEFAIYPTTFSKYGQAYRQMRAGEKGGLLVA